MLDYIKKNKIEMGVITVPQEAAQSVADVLLEGGITGILNFAPVPLKVPQNVVARNIDFSLEMNILTAIKSIAGIEDKSKKQ
jgi:redox-sensing transcriptional repressor